MKILFHPLDAVGHINACVGMGQALAKRGHEVHFMFGSSYQGHLKEFGFSELLLWLNQSSLTATTAVSTNKQNSLNQNASFLAKSGFLSNQTSIEKLMLFDNNAFFEETFNRCCQYNQQIEHWIQTTKPDLIVVDHILIVPSILCYNVPWILLYSSNPLLLYDSKLLPPFSSGYAITRNDNPNKECWDKYRKILDRVFVTQMYGRQRRLLELFGYNLNDVIQLDSQQQILHSPYLNLYGYPKELDYGDVVLRPNRTIRVDAFCRNVSQNEEYYYRPWLELFRQTIQSDEKLVYVSLGSMGAVDLDLMKRLVAILSQTKHRYIVSKGPRHREFELADNMWGEEYVPQPMILPMVDLVITHGGNNTVTESFSFGKPMIVLPLFADQYDNAQRVQEKGFGVRLEAYSFTNKELVNSIDQLLNNAELNQKLRAISERIQQSNSKEKVCIAIEQMIQNIDSASFNS